MKSDAKMMKDFLKKKKVTVCKPSRRNSKVRPKGKS